MTTAIGRTITTMMKTTGATMKTVAITTTAELTITVAVMTIAGGMIIVAATTTVVTKITVVMRITIGKMTIFRMIIATTDNRETLKGTTDRKMSARSDGVLPTTIGGGPALQEPNHRVRRNNTNGNLYQ